MINEIKEEFPDNNLEKIYAENAYEVLPFGICTIDRDLNIIWANKQFRNILPIDKGQLSQIPLQSLDKISSYQLQQLLSGQSDRQVISFINDGTDSPYYVFKVIQRVQNDYVTLLVSPFETLPDQIDKALRHYIALYSLTTAEAAIAKLLMLGFSSEDIRKERKVSISTVRAQKRHLREKMNLQSSMAIVTLIYAYCLSELS